MEVQPDPFQPQAPLKGSKPLAKLDPNVVPPLAVSKAKTNTPPVATRLTGQNAMVHLAMEPAQEKQLTLSDVEAIVAEHGPAEALEALVVSLGRHRNFELADEIMTALPYLEEQLDSCDQDGDTLWMTSVSLGDEEMLSWLEYNGADVSKLDGNGRTGLMRYMLETQHPDVMTHLLGQTKPLTQRYDINAKDESGLSAIAYAFYLNRVDDVWRLMHNKASLTDALAGLPIKEEVRESLVRAGEAGVEFSSKDVQEVQLAIDELLAERIFSYLDEPVDDAIVDECDQFLKSVEPLNPPHFAELQQARTVGSFTLTKSGAEDSIARWEACDIMVRGMARSKMPLTREDILNINRIILHSQDSGKLRDSEITAGGNGALTYLPESQLEDFYDRYCQALTEGINGCEAKELNPIVVAAWAYQALVSIHPFNDANGRSCRMVADYVLQRFGLPPIALEHNVELAVFALNKKRSVSRNQATKIFLEGVKNSYRIYNARAKEGI